MRQMPALYAFLWVNLACMCWAGNLAVGRLLRDEIDSAILVFARTVFAAVLLWLILWALRRRPSVTPAGLAPPWGTLVLMAAAGIVGYQGLLYEGLRTTGALNAALINALCPLMTALMAWAALGTSITPRAWIGIAMSLFGVLAIVTGGQPERLVGLQFQLGDLLVLLAVVLWGAYSLMARRVMQRQLVLWTTALTTTLAVPLAASWALVGPRWHGVAWTPAVLGGVAFVAVFGSVVAMLSWNRAVVLAGPARAAAAMNMLPVYALAASTLLLSEQLHGYQLLGGSMVIAGCLLGTLAPMVDAGGTRAVASDRTSGGNTT